MQSLFFFLVALSLLVVIHEYGHYWVARRCGVKVLRFSVGFGKPLWSRMGKNGTEFVIAALPLGGYVKMLDEREGAIADSDKAYSFNRQPLRNRVAIVSAGPAANLLFAIFAYWVLLISGIPGIKPLISEVTMDSPAAQSAFQSGDEIIAVNGKKTPTWNSVVQSWMRAAQKGETVTVSVLSGGSEIDRQLTLPKLNIDQVGGLLSAVGLQPIRPDIPAVLGEVIRGGSAEQAGLQAGDKLLSANADSIEDWQSWVTLIQNSAGETLNITFERQGNIEQTLVMPEADENNLGRIGAAVATVDVPVPDYLVAEQRYGPLAALPEAALQTWQFSTTMLKSLWGMLAGQVSTDNLGGPITIAQFAGSSAEQGWVTFISFLAMISISLGILNLLPIPMLDGGHLMLYFIEWIKGSPVSEAVQIQSQKIGLILLLMLMVFAFTNDLTRLFG